MSKIGLQLYSIRELAEKDFFKAIKVTAECGYDGIEFAGFFDTPAAKLKKSLEDNGLMVCGSHTALPLLEDEFSKTVEYNLQIDNKNIIIPWIPTDMCNSRDAWLKTSEKMNFISEKLKSFGLKLGYHNHAFEFEKFGGVYGYDIFAANTNSDILLEIDTFWVAYPGEDPVQYVKTYKDRLELLHIKDMGANKKNTEVGSGNIDFSAIIEAAEKTRWFIVEQEVFDMPMETSIKISCDYLKGIL